MADQEFITSQVDELSGSVSNAIEEVVTALQRTLQAKTSGEALEIINAMNIEQVIELKTANIVSKYVAAQKDILLSKKLFAPIREKDLQALLSISEESFKAHLRSMGSNVKQQVVNGIINNKTSTEILEAIGKQGFGKVGMNRIITDGMNNYSRAVSAFMIQDAPKDTKYEYIGPADDRTRFFCLELMSAGELTEAEIRDNGWIDSLTAGGGINCRHNWELAAQDVKTSFHNKDKAQELINA